MTTYKYANAENTIVHVIDDDGISRSSGLTSALVPEGATVEPYAEPPTPIPAIVTMRQARLALLQGDLLTKVNATIASGSEADKITWEFATEVKRDDLLVHNMATTLNLTETDLDNLFILAVTL
jgi:hypothetical protein